MNSMSKISASVLNGGTTCNHDSEVNDQGNSFIHSGSPAAVHDEGMYVYDASIFAHHYSGSKL